MTSGTVLNLLLSLLAAAAPFHALFVLADRVPLRFFYWICLGSAAIWVGLSVA